jgi:O-antigen/teichoic acid export membrane protein
MKKIARGEFARDVTTLAFGTTVGYGLMVISSPIITRLYSPADIGRMGLLLAFLAVASMTASLCFYLAIVGAIDDAEAAHLLLASVILVSFNSLLSVAVLAALIYFGILGFRELPLWAAPMILPLVLITGFFLSFRYWFIREKGFGLISRVTIYQNGGRALSQIALGPVGMGWLGLWFGELIGRGIGLLRMFRGASAKLKTHLVPFKGPQLRDAMRRNYKFPLVSAPSTLLNSTSLNLPPMIIAQLHGAVAAGLFYLVQRVVNTPLVFIGLSIAEVYLKRTATLAKEAPDRLPGFFFKVAGVLFIIGILPAIFLILFAPPAFSLIFGKEWEISGQLAAVMAPWALCQFVVSPLSNIVLVTNKQELKLFFDILSLSGIVLAYLISSAQALSSIQTVVLLSAFQVAAYVILFVILSISALEIRAGRQRNA